MDGPNDIFDDVVQPIQAQALQFQVSKAYSAQLLGALSNMRMKLEDVLRRLKTDIRKKKDTLKLDLEVMNLKAVNGGEGVDNSKVASTLYKHLYTI